MIRAGGCGYLHIPKTGGTMLVKALQSAGLVTERVGSYHGNETDGRVRLTYTQVRCPLRWLASLYVYLRANLTWPGPAQFAARIRGCDSPTFAGWLGKWWRAGLSVDEVYASYTKNADVVGKLESWRVDLADALAKAGETVSVPDIEPVNVKHAHLVVRWEANLADEIMLRERQAFCTHAYDCEYCERREECLSQRS